MFISMETAFYIHLICNLLGLILITIYQSKRHQLSKCPVCFVFYYLFLSISCILILFRTTIPDFFSIVIANTLTVLALVSLYKGIAKTIEVVYYPFVSIIAIVTTFVLFIVFTYAFPSIVIRIVSLNVIHIVLASYVVFLLQSTKEKFSITDEFMSLTLLIYIVVALLRVIANLVYIDQNTDFLNFTLDPIFILAISLVSMTILSGIFSLYNNDYVSKYIIGERRMKSLISNLPGFAYRCYNDEHWTMEFLSKQFEKITGFKIKDIINNHVQSYNDIIHMDFRKEVQSAWDIAIKNKVPYVGEYKIVKEDGSYAWVWEQGIPIYEPDGSCQILEGFIMDISNRKKMEDNLRYLSYNDSLTNLHNRRYLNNKIKEIDKKKNYPISIIMGDINGLKFINDSFGHQYGDDVLKYVASKLQESLGVNDILSRISGDEFIVILKQTSDLEAKQFIKKIHMLIENHNPFDFDVSISLGYYTVKNAEISLSEAQSKAEDNMYIEKTYAKPSNQRKAIDAVLKTLYEKDKLSEQHSQNVSKYAKRLAKVIKLDQQEIEMVETAGLLHDVGKIIIDKSILESTKRLTEDEYNEIKKHPEIGYRILSSVPELTKISEIILYHHERIDGLGYPMGIKGDDIPYFSKLISICDAFDAMVNVRLYRKPLTLEEAIEELKKNTNTQFDKALTDIFIKNINYIYGD